MNKSGWISIAVIVVLLAAAAGYVAGKHGNTLNSTGRKPASGVTTEDRKVLYWKAPMDPNFRSDKPGKSPMGMDLVPVYASDSGTGAASDVKIDPAVVNNLGVRTVEVQQGSLAHRIEAVGYVGYDENTVISINTRADGWVEKLGVKSVGDTVRSGQLLYSLFSPKLATAEREYLTATASGSKTLIRASRERMRALGFTTAQIERLKHRRKVSDRVARRAEGAGVVINLGISEGAYVKPMTRVMQLADLHTVWILAEIDESDIAFLRTGQKAVATFDAFPGQRWSGAVDYIYPDINTATRTAKLRLRFDNPNLRLQPNMYAHITIDAMPQHHVVHIPLQALIRTGHSQRVVVSLGNGRFDVCPVEAGFTSGDQVEILKGLRAGQRVVTSAQFMLDSEANVDAAALRLGSGKAACTSAAAMEGQGKSMSGMKMPVQDLKGGGMERKSRSGRSMSDSMQSGDSKGKQP